MLTRTLAAPHDSRAALLFLGPLLSNLLDPPCHSDPRSDPDIIISCGVLLRRLRRCIFFSKFLPCLEMFNIQASPRSQRCTTIIPFRNSREKVIESIKEAQSGSGSGGGVCVPEAEISAVEARASQLKAFLTNAEASR